MTAQEKEIAMTSLRNDMNSKLLAYQRLLINNATYTDRKIARNEMKELQDEIKRIGEITTG